MTASGDLTQSTVPIRLAAPADGPWIRELLRERWHSTQVITHGEIIDAATLPALVAENGRGLATWRQIGNYAELVTLDAAPTGCGAGSALVEALVELLRGQDCQQLWLTTTNDNLSALKFYLRRGFRLLHVMPGAIDDARRQKPALSLIGRHGIPMHDELALCRFIGTEDSGTTPPWRR
jgi:GNAT superfamily N-acetyltransferase